ncbi:thioredoxin domain-containing protein [Candidatus Woesearchaeota archaeon]|nr:thioredoxin domain-containing protein [Candidatus Woesearchaeota archaeon]
MEEKNEKKEHAEHKHTSNEKNHTHTDKAIFWIGGVQILLMVILIFQVNGLPGKMDLGTAAVDDDADAKPTQPTQPTNPTQPTIDMKKLVDDDTVKGDKDSPVTIVEFSEFECPFCGRYYRDTYGQIMDNYVKTGKVKYVFRDFPLSFHQNAQKAAEAAECAGEQDMYWEMHDKLFESGVTGGVDSFKQYAADIGLDTDDFNSCLDSGKMAAETAKDMQDGQAAGIRGTPGFIINGKLLSGAQPYTAFEAAINEALAAAK